MEETPWVQYKNGENILTSFREYSLIIQVLYSLSSILISAFTLELRRCEYAPIGIDRISSPSGNVSGILQDISQPVCIEMGDCRAPNAGDGDIVLGILPPDSVAQSVGSPQTENESVRVSV